MGTTASLLHNSIYRCGSPVLSTTTLHAKGSTNLISAMEEVFSLPAVVLSQACGSVLYADGDRDDHNVVESQLVEDIACVKYGETPCYWEQNGRGFIVQFCESMVGN